MATVSHSLVATPANDCSHSLFDSSRAITLEPQVQRSLRMVLGMLIPERTAIGAVSQSYVAI